MREFGRRVFLTVRRGKHARRRLQPGAGALDLDGPLLRSDLAVSPLNAAAVERCAGAGIAVIAATARPPRAPSGFGRLQLGGWGNALQRGASALGVSADGAPHPHGPWREPPGRRASARTPAHAGHHLRGVRHGVGVPRRRWGGPIRSWVRCGRPHRGGRARGRHAGTHQNIGGRRSSDTWVARLMSWRRTGAPWFTSWMPRYPERPRRRGFSPYWVRSHAT